MYELYIEMLKKYEKGTQLVYAIYLPPLLWVDCFRKADYAGYERRLRDTIPAGSKVVGKINFRLSFADCDYYAAEDLSKFIKKGLGNFEDYIKNTI